VLFENAGLAEPYTELPQDTELLSNFGLEKWKVHVFVLRNGPNSRRKLSSFPITRSQPANPGFKQITAPWAGQLSF
jgi:hypothetical protein